MGGGRLRELRPYCFSLARDTIVLQHLIIHFPSIKYLSSGRSREVKSKGKLQTFNSFKCGRGCLREVVAYKRFQT